MTRLTTPLIVSTLLLVSTLALGDESNGRVAVNTEMGEGTIRLPEVVTASPPEALSSELSVRSVAYCGGGAPDRGLLEPDRGLLEIEMKMEQGDNVGAYRRLTAALRRGGFLEERTRAFELLAELQLRLGDPERAILNYRRVLAREDAVQNSRVGLAVALLRAGRRRAAGREARSFIDENCASDGDVVACFGAALVVAAGTRDEDERDRAVQLAETLRDSAPDFEEDFGQMQGLLPPRSRLASSASGTSSLAAAL